MKALVAAGGKELLMLTSSDGCSCLHAASHKGQLKVMKALVAAWEQELLMLTSHDWVSCTL